MDHFAKKSQSEVTEGSKQTDVAAFAVNLTFFFFLTIRIEYNPVVDERCCGSNILLLCEEDFLNCQQRTIGPLEPEWGFTTVKRIPGTNDTYLATKVREVTGEPLSTRVVAFTVRFLFSLIALV